MGRRAVSAFCAPQAKVVSKRPLRLCLYGSLSGSLVDFKGFETGVHEGSLIVFPRMFQVLLEVFAGSFNNLGPVT